MSLWRFEHPWALAVGFGMLAVVLWLRLRQDERIGGGIAHLGSARAAIPPLLSMMAYAFAVVAWANPQAGFEHTSETRHGVAILNVIDTSESMEAIDFGMQKNSLTRMDGAKQVVAEFVKSRPHDLHGLVVFGEQVFTLVPMTADGELLQQAVQQIQTKMAGRATAIGDAIALGTKRLRSVPVASKVLILSSDGTSNAGSVEPLEAAEFAKAEGVRIYAIGIGSGDQAPVRVNGLFGSEIRMFHMPMDEGMLAAIAVKTGGSYFNARNIAELADVFDKIDAMEKSEFETHVSVSYVDHYFEYLRWALLLALAAASWQLLVITRFPWL